MIKEKDIIYTSAVSTGRREQYYQDILLKNSKEIIGCLITTFKGLLSSVDERYQVLVEDTEENRKFNHYESEDEGFIFVYFPTIEDFLDFYNKKVYKN